MKKNKRDFLEFLIQQSALLFGNFELVSGRVSPYFFNSGQFNSSKAIALLGKYYARTIVDSKLEYDMLFAPAYKGIPIISSVAVALYEKYGIDVPYCFNRKEAKPHGEGGNLVGAPLKGRVLLIDDVISAGTTVRESANLIADYPTELVGVVTAIDRAEKGRGTISATMEIEQKFFTKVITIVTLHDIIEFLEEKGTFAEHLAAILRYQKKYGV